MSGKAPLNYTTEVSAERSAAECMAMLGQFGAKRSGLAYGKAREPIGLSFVLATRWGDRGYELPVDPEGTRRMLARAYQEKRGNVQRRHTEPDQALRVAWRVIKDWLEANLALIEAGLRDADQVLLPYMLVDHGTTMFDAYNEQNALDGGTR